MSERMSEERLDEIGRKLGEWSSREDWRSVAAALLEDLKTSRAELTAARTVADGEVAETIRLLRDGSCSDEALAELLVRLSAAKEEAERERDFQRNQPPGEKT